MPERGLHVHPLFLVVGVLSSLTGTLFPFLAAVLCALEHECAHAFVAKRYGYSLDSVILMPYGAVVSGDIAGIGKKEELAVLVAGPLSNLMTGIFFVALWWTFPETYPYTELAAQISFSLFFVNLLPAYPLDGGRLLRLMLSPLGERRAKIIGTVVSALVSFGVLAFFVWSCFHTPAWTALAFSLMLLAGAFGGGGSYRRLTFSREASFKRGVEERRVALSADAPLKDALKFLSEEKYLTLLLFEREEFLAEMSEEEVLSALQNGELSTPLKRFL